MAETLALGDGEICRWFSTVFARELSEGAVAAYLSGAAEPFLDAVAHRCDIGDCRSDLQGAFRTLSARPSPSQTLAVEFGSLFLVPDNRSASPYASVHEEGRLFGAAHERMRARLAKAGLSPAGWQDGPTDHLSIMLEYLACVHEGSVRISDLGDHLERDLMPLASAFADRTRNANRDSGFYQALSSMLVRYLDAVVEPRPRNGW